MALWQVYILQPGGLTPSPVHHLSEALDTVVGLSLGHGHLEVLNGSLTSGGLEGLESVVEREELLGNPLFAPDGRPAAPGVVPPGPAGPEGGPIPEPSGPGGFPIPEPRPGTGAGGLPIPGHIHPPPPGDCEIIREACEAWLIDAVNAGLPPLPLPPAVTAWADNIDRIELLGRCAGDIMVIHGHDFGSPKPPHVHLIMKVRGECEVVPVDPADWSDTRITVTLPDGVMPGPVGFYDAQQAESERNRYNREVARYNRGVRQVATASKCLGRPLDLPTFSPAEDRIPCPPGTSVNMVEAGLPLIRSFTVASDTLSGTEIVAAPEDELVLRWNVENADTIALEHRWETGSASVREVLTNDAIGSSWYLGAGNHEEFGVSTYRLTARNACGPVEATAQVVRSQRPRLSIERIEVTQSIQTAEHDVPLVRQKPTLVRAYATHGLNGFGGLDTVANVTGRLRVRSGGSLSSWFSPVNGVVPTPPDPPLPDPAAAIDLPENPDPTQTDHTLNFIIPEALCVGTIDVEVELRVNDFGAPPGLPGFSERVSALFERIVTFHSRRQLKMRYIPATVVPDPNGNVTISIIASNPPTDDECRSYLLETFKFLPTMPSSIERLEGVDCTFHMDRTVLNTPWGSFQIDSGWSESLIYDVEANTALFWLGLIRTCELLGSTGTICSEDHDALWAILVPIMGVWGRANGIPGREYITPMLDGRPGVVGTGAHELAHCLNQHHLVGAGCANGGSPSGDPFEGSTNPSEWPDGGQILPERAVPFDIIRNQTIVDGGSDGVWDLMSYCRTRWTTPKRWQMIFDFVGG
ncbi:MAG: hypothetical protein ACOY93_06590 [Bacillota bacterium]